jgi:hypothetical protein
VTPDEIIAEIFRIQTERSPDTDPGDINIDIQDDSPATIVMQRGRNFPPYLGIGGSIQEALENALAYVKGTCPVCLNTGVTYDATEKRDVPCGGIGCSVVDRD